MSFRKSRLFAALILGLLPMAQATVAGEPPKIWLNHFQLGMLATAADADWPETRSGLDTAFFAINTLWPMKRPMRLSIAPAKAAAAAAKLHREGIHIGVECGYFDHSETLRTLEDPASDVIASASPAVISAGVGERTARVEIAKMRSWWQAGQTPDYLVLDDPIRRLTVPGQDSPGQILQGMPDYESASREVTAYMRVMRAKFPAVKFVVILNFPNWGWKGAPAFSVAPGRMTPMNWGDAHAAMEILFSTLARNDLRIDAIQGDFPWRYFAEPPSDAIAATVDWPGRILELEHYARDKGVRFQLTANSEAGYTSAKAFADDSLKYLDAYLAVGGKPDRFVVQSWYPHPQELLPESTPYTGTWLAARFVRRLREIQAGTPVAAGPRVPRPFDRSEPEALLQLLQILAPDEWKSLAPAIFSNWLDRQEDPPASLASGELLALRAAVAKAADGKPKATIVLRNRSADVATGLPPLPLKPGPGQICIVEVIGAASESTLASAWMEGSKSDPTPLVWISPGGSRLLAVALDLSSAKNGVVILCVGKPGGFYRKVAVMVKPADALP